MGLIRGIDIMFEINEMVHTNKATMQSAKSFIISSVTSSNIVELLRELKQLELDGIISPDELEAKKSRLLRL